MGGADCKQRREKPFLKGRIRPFAEKQIGLGLLPQDILNLHTLTRTYNPPFKKWRLGFFVAIVGFWEKNVQKKKRNLQKDKSWEKHRDK
jgi:hypothetical protein